MPAAAGFLRVLMRQTSRYQSSLHIIAACACISFAASLRPALAIDPEPASRETAAIQAVLDAQRDAWNRGDVDAYMEGYARSDDTEFVGGDTVTRGWQTVRDRYRKKYDTPKKMGALTFSDVHIQMISRDAALVTGRWELARESDQPHGRFTLLFRRIADGWRIVHDHTSSG